MKYQEQAFHIKKIHLHHQNAPGRNNEGATQRPQRQISLYDKLSINSQNVMSLTQKDSSNK